MFEVFSTSVHPRRAAYEPMKRPHEVREILEAHVIGDFGNGPLCIQKHSDRQPDSRSEKVLMRRCPRDAPENAQEMERADSSPGSEFGER